MVLYTRMSVNFAWSRLHFQIHTWLHSKFLYGDVILMTYLAIGRRYHSCVVRKMHAMRTSSWIKNYKYNWYNSWRDVCPSQDRLLANAAPNGWWLCCLCYWIAKNATTCFTIQFVSFDLVVFLEHFFVFPSAVFGMVSRTFFIFPWVGRGQLSEKPFSARGMDWLPVFGMVGWLSSWLLCGGFSKKGTLKMVGLLL